METIEKNKETKKFKLPNKKVTIKFINKQRGMVDDPDHVLFGGLGPNAYKGYQVPTDSRVNRYIKSTFSDKELEALEKEKGYEPGTMSLLRKDEKNDYWRDYMIKLDRNDRPLNLADPNDFIFYKVALAQKDFVAPSQDKVLSGHMWVIEDEQLAQLQTDKRVSNMKQAIMLLGKHDSSIAHLRQIVLESKGGARIPESRWNDLGFMQREAGKLADNDPDVFIKIANDPDLEFKASLRMGVHIGAVKRKGTLYYHLDDEKLALPGQKNDLEGAVAYLSSPENSEFYLKLVEQINQSL